ncbi:acylneuraminate cytidylyltransferase family protein [Catenovulum sp. SM1970]|uniref:acylneuraminate cytidylyltransferase family protein n=1 Tax=Marinifaba aquimaris TaxID=2741323 RepID=UPI0015729406|nr:acylneuraminate cytidylyltransferase family protein [Marinifaba aquimaris]NTS75361.1 acylneuraminate cytidylyltransferase family protein [Marinifaba aquimaris]
MKHIAIIPARSGSKRLPNKNLKIFVNKPLIAWTIDAALQSKVFSEVIVSTDCQSIADVAIEFGAKVPFLRDSTLASDDAKSADVAMDVIEKLALSGEDEFTWLQPTSPLRTSECIRQAMQQFKLTEADSLVSVTECEHSPLWSCQVSENNQLSSLIAEQALLENSQSLPTYFRFNGAIYINQVGRFKQSCAFYSSIAKTTAFKMPNTKSVDIDTELDFMFAELIMQQGLNE